MIRTSKVDFSSLLRPGDGIVFAQACAEPLTLTEALTAQATEIRETVGQVQVFLGGSWSGLFTPDLANAFKYVSYGALGDCAALARAGKLSVLPCHYARLPSLLSRGHVRSDVVLLQLARARDGRLCLGAASDYLPTALRQARVVVAEVNAQAPCTYGSELPDHVKIDVLIESDRPLVEVRAPDPDDTGRKIAAHVASLVPEHSTVQMGIGSIMSAICAQLKDHRGLRAHAGIMTDGVSDLLARGVVQQATTGSLFGTDRLFRCAHENAQVRVEPVEITHGPATLSTIPAFCAINSAIEVDLTGQVNAEVNRGMYVGAIGGQVDFHRAAAASIKGRAIVALPSTAGGGKISRIVPALAGVPVTTGRADVDCVVTEWGCAQLRGLSIAQRTEAMVKIAHPQFRDALRAAARIL